MGKGKKKHSKKGLDQDDLLDAAALSVKKFGKVTKAIAKLSTGQKIVGGIVLIAAGLTYLAKQDFDADENPHQSPKDEAPQLALGTGAAPDDEEAPPPRATAAPRKSRKSPKAKHEG